MKNNKYNSIPIIFVLLIVISIGYIIYLNFFDSATDKILTFKSGSIDINNGNEYDLTNEIYQEDIKPDDIVWISNNEEVATVDENGILTLLSNGTTEIIARSGSGIESSLFVNVNRVSVDVDKLELNEREITASVGSKRTLIVNIFPKSATNKGIVWDSSDRNIVDVSTLGVITLKNEGVAIISATAPNGKYAICRVTVTKEATNIPVSKIEIDQKDIRLNVGNNEQLKAVIYPENATNHFVTWTSSDTNVVSVSPTGLITAVGVGNATITARSNNGKEDRTLVSTTQEIENLEISEKSLFLIVGWKKQINATIMPEKAVDKTLTWTSSDSNIATVSGDGLITAKNAGFAIITIKTSNEKTKEIEVTVTNSVVEINSISINSANFSLDVGFSKNLDIIMQPSNATIKKLTWTSSNTNIATVNNDGLVVAKKTGTTKITAKTDNGKTATVSMTVKKNINVNSIKINQSNFSLVQGMQKQLSITISPSNATNKDITWSSSDKSVVNVSNSGLITGLYAGTATITAKSNNGKIASISVTIEPKEIPVAGINLDTSNFQLEVGKTRQLTTIISPSNTTARTVTWFSNDTNIATVSSTGLVTAKSAGNVTITAKTNNGKTATATIKVSAPIVSANSIKLNKTSLRLNTNDTYRLVATISPSNATDKTVTWSSNHNDIAAVSSTGLVTARKSGSATIKAKTTNGKIATATVEVSVATVYATSIRLNTTSLNLNVNDTYNLVATISPSNATDKTVTWSSSNNDVATVSNTGLVTAKSGGSVTVTANTNNGKTVSTTIKVINLPIDPPAGANIKFSAYSPTLKTSIQLVGSSTSTGYYITRLWVVDPYQQFSKVMTNTWGRELSESTINMIDRAVSEKGLTNKIVIGTNASGFHSPSIDSFSGYNYTSTGSLVITNGQVIRNDYSNTSYKGYTIYGIDQSGKLRDWMSWKGQNHQTLYQDIINSGIKDTINFSVVLVGNGQVITGDKAKTKHTIFCQIDSNNFIIGTFTNDRRDFIEIANIMVNLGCKTAVNFDGGSSTGLVHKSAGDSQVTRFYGGTRKVADAFYVTE